jgi:hypothetical protein
MATTGASGAPPILPDFGPSLPALVRRRFGVRERVTTAVAVVLAGVVAAVVLAAVLLTGPDHLTYRAGPTFNLQYEGDLLHRVAPKGDELVRLEAHRGALSASITVSALSLPAYQGNVTSGLMPVFAHRFEDQLRSSTTGFVEHDEGSARVNDAQGYQLGFRSGPPGLPTWGRDILLVPRDEDVTEGVVLRLRQTKAGAFTKRDEGLLGRVRRAFKSFNFGTDRAEW